MTDIPENVQAWIAKLGEMSPEDIVELLRAEGIKGHANISSSCPIARLIHSMTGVHVLIGGRVYTLDDADSPVLPAPESVGAFVDDFDSGNYPDLEEAARLLDLLDSGPGTVKMARAIMEEKYGK